jgi:outer membrane protein OmpA-like peptidoglycan-associated protein
MLNLEPDARKPEAPRRRGAGLALLIGILVGALAGLGYVLYTTHVRMRDLQRQMADLQARAAESDRLAREASARASTSEAAARAAAEGRQLAEAESGAARAAADAARQEATSAQETATLAQQEAARARAEAEAIRKRAEAEVNRLEAALGQIAETKRTALGVVMNLGSDHLKFAFDKAELRPEDKELLARIAGILLTSKDYTISVNGHTDDVGTDAYNQQLSERRAQAVRDYLVQAGLSPSILSVEGHGKKVPLERGTTERARARNRRVELGIVNTQIRYGRSALPSPRPGQ